MPYYLMVPDQLFTVFAAAAIALRLQQEGAGPQAEALVPV
jgi:hypothetical protein